MAQPASTYFQQKISHDVIGITDHSSGTSMVYLFDECIGAKNTDHTVSYLSDFLSKTAPWIRRVHLFIDNASSTNKIFFTMAWAYEIVQQCKLDLLRSSLLVVGHTKSYKVLIFEG